MNIFVFCLECRVLRINLERKRLHLTSKPILVKEEFTVVDSYESAKVGTVTEVSPTRNLCGNINIVSEEEWFFPMPCLRNARKESSAYFHITNRSVQYLLWYNGTLRKRCLHFITDVRGHKLFVCKLAIVAQSCPSSAGFSLNEWNWGVGKDYFGST